MNIKSNRLIDLLTKRIIGRRAATLTEKLINQSHNEILIEVDEQNRELGPVSKYHAHTAEFIKAGRLHRAFSLFVFDHKNQLLLQKRSKHKVTFASLWTNSCCSHPLYNDEERIVEAYKGARKAAQRRLNYELNIKHGNLEDFKCIDAHTYSAMDIVNPNWGEFECKFKRRSRNSA